MPIESLRKKQRKMKTQKHKIILIVSVFIAGLCSLIYELLIATTASYFEGDSITQFSITIGLYMAFMGVGSFISRFLQKKLIIKFLSIELLLSFLGGVSIPVLYLIFAYSEAFYFYKIIFTGMIAILIGLEIPLLVRLMKKHYTLKTNISNILSLDYLGALVATLLFPFLLFPFLGTFKTSLLFGLMNMGLVLMNLIVFSGEIKKINPKIFSKLALASIVVTACLVTTLASSNFLIRSWTGELYSDRIIYMKRSPYQNIILTKYKNDIRMYLNGGLQLSSIDEYRYHESLVHIPMELLKKKDNILVLGGGDGMAVREILKYPTVKSIHLVDLDEKVIELARKNDYLRDLNQNSLSSNKVKVYTEDAFTFLRNLNPKENILNKDHKKFDLIIADLPDPSHISLAKLYTYEFYRLVKKNLHKEGIFVTQATSPFHAKSAFWCIQKTIFQAGFETYPYHLNIPSFAEWGFIIGSLNQSLKISSLQITKETKFLDDQVAKSLFIFSKDIKGNCKGISSLEKPVILTHYLKEWLYE